MIPQHPRLDMGTLALARARGKHSFPSIIDNKVCFATMNARSALQIGLGCLGLQKDDEVLVPAYHCPVMVYPILKSGCRAVFYKIKEDLFPDFTDLRQKLGPRSKILIAVHYFGFPTGMMELRALCNENKLYLIEDCAHAFFGYTDGGAIGSFGDFSIGSLWKFFPLYEGGVLAFGNPGLAEKAKVVKGSVKLVVKLLVNTLEVRGNPAIGRLLSRAVLRLKRLKEHSGREDTGDRVNSPGSAETPRNPYRAEIIGSTYSRASIPLLVKLVPRFVDRREIVRRRRRNYYVLHEEVRKIRGVEGIFRELPEGCVPYVFPIVSRFANELARTLRKNGIEILRFGEYLWDGVDEKVCKLSSELSKYCIQLPIHQSMRERDVKMVSEIIRRFSRNE